LKVSRNILPCQHRAGLRHRGGENPAVGIGGGLRRRHRLQHLHHFQLEAPALPFRWMCQVYFPHRGSGSCFGIGLEHQPVNSSQAPRRNGSNQAVRRQGIRPPATFLPPSPVLTEGAMITYAPKWIGVHERSARGHLQTFGDLGGCPQKADIRVMLGLVRLGPDPDMGGQPI
jgi:hypothetical protein